MSEDRFALDYGAPNRLAEAVRTGNGQRHRRFYKLRDDGMLPLICPTCQNVCAGKASMPATPCYFAWGCFRYFSWEREPRRIPQPGAENLATPRQPVRHEVVTHVLGPGAALAYRRAE